jgi:hypothetical protein
MSLVTIIAIDQAIGEIPKSFLENIRINTIFVRAEGDAKRRFLEELNQNQGQNIELITGTSEKSIDDSYFWKESRDRNIPSTAYVDQWSNLEKRFSDIDKQGWPHQVVVIDQKHKDVIKRIAPRNVKVKVEESQAVLKVVQEVELLRLSNYPKIDNRILFVTEPQEDEILYKIANGFNDFDSFELVTKLITNYHPSAFLSIRLHPRDSRLRWIKKIPKTINYEWDSLTRAESIVSSEIIFGMRSMFLIEAYKAGANVISLQPNRKEQWDYLESSGIKVVKNEKDYIKCLS